MKFSILMPTYNDENSILGAISSVISQDYFDFELIIVDDGSNDNTVSIVKKIQDSRIKYIYQDNSDQLNALILAFNHSSGDIIYILHSDDLLFDRNTLKNAAMAFEKFDAEAIKGKIYIIDESNKITGLLKQRKITSKIDLLGKTMLLFGTNLLNDFAFIRRNAFVKFSLNNYLTWNTPFWINWLANGPELINVINLEFGMLKYRRHNNNYINNEIGKLNVLNGNIRTFTLLMKYYTIPFFSIQRFIFRILKDSYKPLIIKKETKNKHRLLKMLFLFRIGISYKKYDYFLDLLNYYKYFKGSSRVVSLIEKIEKKDVFLGKDMRKFNVMMINNKLPELYTELFKEMSLGFKGIKTIKNNLPLISDILTFLSLNNKINIELIDEK